MCIRDSRLNIALLGAQFDGAPVHLSLWNTQMDLRQQEAHANPHRRFVGDEPRWYVDVVFYHGEEREIPLRALKDAYAALCVSLEGVAPEECRVEKDGDMLRAHARMAGAAMDVHSPCLLYTSRCV